MGRFLLNMWAKKKNPPTCLISGSEFCGLNMWFRAKIKCSLSTYWQDVSRQHHQLHWLIGTKGEKCLQSTQQKWNANMAIHLLPRRSSVNVVFTFNASAICAAPSTPISLPVYFREKKKENLAINFNRKQENHSHTPKINLF